MPGTARQPVTGFEFTKKWPAPVRGPAGQIVAGSRENPRYAGFLAFSQLSMSVWGSTSSHPVIMALTWAEILCPVVVM